jgi:hypothetical protein
VSDNPEVDKAVNQMEAQRPPVENAAEAVDKSVGVYSDTSEFYEGDKPTPAPAHADESEQAEPEADKPAPKKAAKKSAKKTSGDRAAKNSTTEKE